MKNLAALLSLILAPYAAAQGNAITYAEGSSPTALTIQTVDEAALGAPQAVLTQCELLPIEMTGRTAQDEMRADRARRVDRSGVMRIELTSGGRLLHYRLRGGDRYGFLLITPQGKALVVQEIAGTGATGKDEPYADRIGVAPDGVHAGLVTLAGALSAARLDGGSYASTGSPSRSISSGIDPLSVMPGATHVFFQSGDERVWRCSLADNATPQDVTPPKQGGDRLKVQMARSGDGSAVAFLLGPKDLYSIWLLGTSGAAVKLPPPPAKYEEAGYLPEIVGGPRLLLNDDATRLFYEDHTTREELYLLDTSGFLPTTQVTSSANFQPYIGTVIFPMFAGTTLALAVGDPQAMDWYTAQAGTASVANLTRTGGNLSPPFGAGALDPQQASRTVSALVLSTEVAGGGTQLRAIDPTSGASTVVASALRGPPVLGDALSGAADIAVPSLGGDRLLSSQGGALLLAAPPGVILAPSAREASNGFTLFRASLRSAAAAVFLLPGGALVALPDDQLVQTVLTRGGGALLGDQAIRYFGPGRSATLSSMPLHVVLSGAGA